MTTKINAAETLNRISADLDKREPDKLLTTQQAAELLGVSKIYMEALRARAMGPVYIRLAPRLIRYRYADVCNWLNRHARLGCKPVLVPRYPPET